MTSEIKYRNLLYRITVLLSVAFCVACVALMLVYCLNAEYFDTHGRISTLAQNELAQANLETQALSAYKKNVSVNYVDTREGKLSLKLQTPVNAADISLREEFTKEKLVVTIKNGIDCVTNGQDVASDSGVMDAVGIYTQNSDLVIEIYADGKYAYGMSCENGILDITLSPIYEIYDRAVVVYIPFSERTRLTTAGYGSDIQTKAAQSGIKLYVSSNMQEEYTKTEVCDFANDIRADIMLLLDYKQVDEATDTGIAINYSSGYFIPEFGNSELATLLGKQLTVDTGLALKGYRECTEGDEALANAKIPTAEAVIYTLAGNKALETEYAINHGVLTTIGTIMEGLTEDE